MKGKIGLVVGLGVGYVLGTRAGRERYEQIKTQWLKVWNTDPVQERVDKVKGFVGDKAAAVRAAYGDAIGRVFLIAAIGSILTLAQEEAAQLRSRLADGPATVSEQASSPATKTGTLIATAPVWNSPWEMVNPSRRVLARSSTNRSAEGVWVE